MILLEAVDEEFFLNSSSFNAAFAKISSILIIEELWKEEKEAIAYVIQNVYGKLQVYVDVDDESLISRIKVELEEKIEDWLGGCGCIQKNGFLKTEIESYIKTHAAFKDRIWIIEKYLTNVYWNEGAVRNKKLNLIPA